MFNLHPSRSNDPAFNLGPSNPLTRATFIAAIRKPLNDQKLARGIHGHSFRIGGATLLAAAGYPDHIIQLAGRWQSSTFLRYIRQHDHILPQTTAILATQPFPSSWNTSVRSQRSGLPVVDQSPSADPAVLIASEPLTWPFCAATHKSRPGS